MTVELWEQVFNFQSLFAWYSRIYSSQIIFCLLFSQSVFESFQLCNEVNVTSDDPVHALDFFGSSRNSRIENGDSFREKGPTQVEKRKIHHWQRDKEKGKREEKGVCERKKRKKGCGEGK